MPLNIRISNETKASFTGNNKAGKNCKDLILQLFAAYGNTNATLK
jgi:hypothetical protein